MSGHLLESLGMPSIINSLEEGMVSKNFMNCVLFPHISQLMSEYEKFFKIFSHSVLLPHPDGPWSHVTLLYEREETISFSICLECNQTI